MANFKKNDDYVEVADRIREFRVKHPDGRLQTEWPPQTFSLGGKDFIAVRAWAYRSPDDPLPAHGVAWEPVPGPTSFTKDSELMNAETAAWGRALVAVGLDAKRIASAEEVRARQPERAAPAQVAKPEPPNREWWVKEMNEELHARGLKLSSLAPVVGEMLNVKEGTEKVSAWFEANADKKVGDLIALVPTGAA